MIQVVSSTDETSQTTLTGLVHAPCPLCGHPDSQPETMVAGYELARCCQCRFVFMNPRCTPAHLDAIYAVRDEQALIRLYAGIATPGVIDEYKEKLRCIERLVPQKGRLLDFACAAGYFFEQAQARGWDAHGCDVGQWTAAAASERGLKNLHVGELNELGFPEGHFDVVYAAQVFEHLLDPQAVLRGLVRILKPGGLLYVDVPNYHTLPIMAGRDDFMLNEPPQHINYFVPATLRRLLQSCQLESITVSSDGGLKWENLLGRPITSDIAEAYGLVDEMPASPKRSSPSVRDRLTSAARQMVKSTVINPLLYRRLHLGMNLAAWCRRPCRPSRFADTEL